MVTKRENIAAENVMQMQEEKYPDSYDNRLTQFRTSTAVFRNMIEHGILSEKEYEEFCDKLAEKYGVSLCSIFR